ncbi:MAG TPA: amino acid adenylation domain-containing protein [Thermoanaerobaculia bacterium]|jgi:amino acid adenylation domain-containing protein|nr:amino acid adenylation domain-containing protein [Thermoanaerobaculia bacterium]
MNRKHEHNLNREEIKRLLHFLHEAPESRVGDHLPDERLRAYVREELPPSMVEQMDYHLASCEDCAERMEWLLAMTEALAAEAQHRQPVARALVSFGNVDPCASRWSEPAIEHEGKSLEALMAHLLAELLGSKQVGHNNSFFDLGGHSLLATQLTARVREVFGAELDLRSLFESSTVAGLAERIKRLSGENVAPSDLVRWAGSGDPPLSFAQQRLWFLDQLQSGSVAYNVPIVLRFSGLLRPHRLIWALSEVVRRHDILRTTFKAVGDSPVQVVHLPAEWSVPWVDLRRLPPKVRESEAIRLADEEASRPFDLERGPLLRTTMLTLDDTEFRMLLTMHHIISDGWSVEVVQRELGVLYSSLDTGPPPPLSELPVQYADFAAWQRRHFAGQVLEAELRYWRRQLAGAPRSLNLPLDRPRPPRQRLQVNFEQVSFPSDLLESLERFGRSRGATLFMTLLAGFEALLQRITGQGDFLLGSPVPGRSRRQLEELIGFFVNTLVQRAELEDDPRFPELVRRVRETTLTAYAHQDFPFERLVEEMEPRANCSGLPYVQVMLCWAPGPSMVEMGRDLRLEIAKTYSGVSDCDLSLFLRQTNEGRLKAVAWYASELFEAPTVRRLLDWLGVLLQNVAVEPEARISDLSLLSSEEREQVLKVWNRTATEIPPQPVHELFLQWAKRTPDALAVGWESGQLTYRDLKDRASRLAQRLQGQGVGPETVVALCLDRSPDLVTAALAVLQSGGCYLPMDPVFPAERLAWTVRDSGAVLLVTTRALAPSSVPVEMVLLDDVHAEERPSFPPLSDPGGNKLAYVIYTSGSTGTPKGCELSHHGLSNLIAWHHRTYQLGPADRSALLAGPGFDASVWETWAPLTAGASLHIPPREVIPSPSRLLDWIAERRITVMFLPTPLAEAVLAERLPEGLMLRTLLTGGDRLLVRPRSDLPFEIVNHYGPTESTVVATAGRVSPQGERKPGIGLPVANTRVYVLDLSLQPVPMGVPGELCLAGDALARGYLGRPDLTAERFLPDPFSSSGSRLYRTGDLARWLPQGDIEFLGRRDHQIKAHGYRIELGEIETSLMTHPHVEAAVVLAREGAAREPRLVAYVVPAPGQEPGIAALRSFLEAWLPSYLIPSAFVFLPTLPLTPNGKVDRRALPEPEPLKRGTYPSSPLELIVAEAWKEVLEVDRVDVDDSFWKLGGDSILATRVLARLENSLEVDLPLKTMFLSPTLRQFAKAVGEVILISAQVGADCWTDTIQDLHEEPAGELEEIA